eukprot:365747-Chlamydomonas_euryale.AAC.21
MRGVSASLLFGSARRPHAGGGSTGSAAPMSTTSSAPCVTLWRALIESSASLLRCFPAEDCIAAGAAAGSIAASSAVCG